MEYSTDAWTTLRSLIFWKHAMTVHVEDTSHDDLLDKKSFEPTITGQHSLLMLRLILRSVMLVRDTLGMISTWTFLSNQLYPFRP